MTELLLLKCVTYLPILNSIRTIHLTSDKSLQSDSCLFAIVYMDQGQDKIRYERLRVVCIKALQESIKKSLSSEQIRKCYPTLASSEEGVKSLEIARTQIIDFWLNSSITEFDQIFKERDIKNKLDTLDDIIELAKARSLNKSVPPVYLNKLTPKDIITANKNFKKNEALESLNLIYKQLNAENAQLFDRLKTLADQSKQVKDDIIAHVASLNKELDLLKDDKTNIRINELLDTLVDEL